MSDHFDPDEYRRRYPDVAMSGLNARDHYRMFAKLLNRHVQPPAPEPHQKAAAPQTPPLDIALIPKQDGTVASARKAEPEVETKKERPTIIDRPSDFSAEDSIVRAAPPRSGVEPGGRIALAALMREGSEFGALVALGRLLEQNGRTSGSNVEISGDTFRVGAHRIDNAWISPTETLRLIIADDPGRKQGWAIRGFQVDAEDATQLRQLGSGATLPNRGPSLVELNLFDPLLPVLLELSDQAGKVHAVALLPFPSLLPGGLHAAELRAMQVAPNPMQAFWTLSETLLNELLAGTGELSVSVVASPSEQTVRWLSKIFQFSPGGEHMARPGRASTLKLPSNAIPTISILAARGNLTEATMPFLVADAETLRPRWAVTLPAFWQSGDPPTLQNSPDQKTGKPRSRPYAAIAFPTAAIPAVAASPTDRPCAKRPAILLTATDPARTERIVTALLATFGAPLELHVKLPRSLIAVSDALDRMVQREGWRPATAGIIDVAIETDAEELLTIDDRVEAFDAALIDTLSRMLGQHAVASAGCVLLQEASIKKKKVLQPATGGLFPAAVSFVGSPDLTFAEPNVLEALPATTFPVIANTLHLTLWRTKALTAIHGRVGVIPPEALDIAVGLALVAEGHMNLCTTECAAKIVGPYVPRDVIDPISQSRLAHGDWQAVLDRVTLLRKLY